MGQAGKHAVLDEDVIPLSLRPFGPGAHHLQQNTPGHNVSRQRGAAKREQR